MTKIFEILDNRCHHEYPEYQSIEDTIGLYSNEIVFVEAPDCVWEGFGFDPTKEGDARFIQPELSEGWEYNEYGLPWNPIEYRANERKDLHASTTDDTMEALRKLREGDTSHDWEAWLNLLDAYNVAISETVNQPTYPHNVQYPEYPTRPWEVA